MSRTARESAAAHPERDGVRPIPGRTEGKDIALVMALALVVRAIYLFMNARGNPAFDYLIMDSMHIDRWARAIAAGEPTTGVYFRGPLYPQLLALLYRAGGGVMAAVVLNHAAGVLTCGLTYAFAREYFARSVALVAGLVAALYWPFIYFEGEVLIEPVFVLLVTLTLWRLAHAAAHPSLARAAVAGACLGLAALARPSILVLVPVLPLVFAARRPEHGGAGGGGRAWLRPSATALAVCAVVLAPAMLHNWKAAKAFVPVAWSGGLNFYIGNNEHADGRSAFIPGARAPWMGGEEEALAIARAAAGRELSAPEASDYYLRRGVGWIAGNPGAALQLGLSKLHMFWEGPERSNEKYIYFFWDRFGLGRVPMPGFWLVSPLALAAMVQLWRHRRGLALPYLFVAAYALGVVVFFVVGRLRLPVVPVLIVFAAWTLVELAGCARARRWASLARTASYFVVAFVVVNLSYPPFLRTRSAHVGISHYTLAAASMEKGNKDRAIVELEAARRSFEAVPSKHYAAIAQDVYFKLGTLWYERGRCDEAANALGQLQPTDPRAGEARMMFAACCEKVGRFIEAGRAYGMMVRADPKNRAALEGLIRCLEETGQFDAAAEARKALEGL
jgi:4-amino-4-deoxy-L-arabinose transferase-like glycosyltransferase